MAKSEDRKQQLALFEEEGGDDDVEARRQQQQAAFVCGTCERSQRMKRRPDRASHPICS